MNRLICCCVFVSVLAGCSKISLDNATDRFLEGERLARLDNSRLQEISGGVTSASNPEMLWFHNDSGNPAEIYLVDQSLQIKLTCKLPVENRDWEDMAIGPGPEDGKTYIYLAEIGDNDGKYETKFIYRFEEPQWDQRSDALTIQDIDTIAFQLEGKKKDTETLLLDPATRDLFVVSKRESPVTLYHLPFPHEADSTLIAKKLFSLPFTQIVGGDISADGKGVLIKNYEHIYFWQNDGGQPIEDVLKQRPFEVPYELEPQGEAILWKRDGSGFFTISEKKVGKNSYLYLYPLRDLR